MLVASNLAMSRGLESTRVGQSAVAASLCRRSPYPNGLIYAGGNFQTNVARSRIRIVLFMRLALAEQLKASCRESK